MDKNQLVTIRRANLKKWFTAHDIPSKEKSYISQLMNGKASFGETAARRLERDYGMGERYLDTPEGADLKNDSTLDEKYTLINVLTARLSMGKGCYEDHVEIKHTQAFRRDFLREKGVMPEHANVVIAEGESNSPAIPPQSRVLINTADTLPKHGKFFAILDIDEGLKLKRLTRDGNGGWIINSFNIDKNRYPDEPFETTRHTILGKAISFSAELD